MANYANLNRFINYLKRRRDVLASTSRQLGGLEHTSVPAQIQEIRKVIQDANTNELSRRDIEESKFLQTCLYDFLYEETLEG